MIRHFIWKTALHNIPSNARSHIRAASSTQQHATHRVTCCRAPLTPAHALVAPQNPSQAPHRAGLMPSSMLVLPPGRYTTEPDLASVDATSRAASMRRSSIMPGPAERVASEISRALSDSPSARMTAALRSCAQARTRL